jgi:hypothetical protein
MLPIPQDVLDQTLAHAEKIVNEGTAEQQLAFFAFDKNEPRLLVAFKFKYWAFKVYPRYYKNAPADFHDDFIINMLKSYYNEGNYLNLGFRGCAKTTYTKLFITFVLLNDMDHTKRYIKVLARNFGNAKQMVTDIFNMISEVKPLYGNILMKEKDKKKEETMAAFTTVDGVKLMAGTIGMTQRGHLQDAYRPDFLVFDDVEDRESIQSLSTTESTIWRIDEAIQGLSDTGSYICLGNYISEEGVIQWFLNKPNITVDKIAIIDEDGNPTWPERYSKEKIELLKADAEDWYGEYLCDPTRADATFFDRNLIDRDLDQCKQPMFEENGIKYWGKYQPYRRYAIGADTSEGIGRDANTFALFDFGVHPDDPAILIATYFNNNIPPDLFGSEVLWKTGQAFGNCLVAPEANNTGHSTLAALRGYPNIYTKREDTRLNIKRTEKLGWNTTRKSKPMMLFDFRDAYNKGLIKIYDKNVLKEMRSYTTMDLTDTKHGMVTRHFDLLMAVCIAFQMRKYAIITANRDYQYQAPVLYDDIGI